MYCLTKSNKIIVVFGVALALAAVFTISMISVVTIDADDVISAEVQREELSSNQVSLLLLQVSTLVINLSPNRYVCRCR